MSKSKKLRPSDRHITRAECQALIVHTLNEVFGTLAGNVEPVAGEDTDAATPDCPCNSVAPCAAHALIPPSDCEACHASATGFYAGPDCGHAPVTP